MADKGLIDAFNDCIDRLARGDSVESCLRQYPEYAQRLRPMLETGIVLRRAQASHYEVERAQERVRSRVVEAMTASTRRSRFHAPRLLTLAASLLLVFVFVISGAVLLSNEMRLRGEPTAFASPIPPTTLAPTATETQAATEPATATATATPTMSPSPTASGTPTPTSTLPPSPTITHTPTVLPSAILGSIGATATATITGRPGECVPTPPDDWAEYTIQAGDTLSGLAARGGVTIDEVAAVNCLSDTRIIIAGTRLYLPENLSPPSPPVIPPSSNDNVDDDDNRNDNRDSGRVSDRSSGSG